MGAYETRASGRGASHPSPMFLLTAMSWKNWRAHLVLKHRYEDLGPGFNDWASNLFFLFEQNYSNSALEFRCRSNT